MGMPEDARLAAAVVDSALRDRWDWLQDILNVILGEEIPKTSSWAEQILEEHGWRDVEDVYDAARVSKAQRWAWELYLMHHTNREIGIFLGVSAHDATLQVLRAKDKLTRVLLENEL